MKALRAILAFAGVLTVQAFAAESVPSPPKPQSIVVVEGAVQRPGRVEFPQGQGPSIVGAISLAGGQTRLADLKQVWLFRASSADVTVKMVVDVDAILKGRGEDVPLQNGDRVVVNARDLKK